MSTSTAGSPPSVKEVNISKNYEQVAWRWMRYSGVLLIPLVWIHTILQDVIVGVHAIDLNYVEQRFALVGWRIFDAALLGFAFAHGVNGLRQVLFEYIKTPYRRRLLAWSLLIMWFVITAIGAAALIGGVRPIE
jgi:succinate dehydrogenase / fumarate reductase, membrane anchor subunit